MAVEPAKVKQLREKTGLPMMECKRALEAVDGEVEKAYEELRKAGLKAQEKLAGRTANEGRIGASVGGDGKVGVLVALRCETEPVAKNDEFQKLLGQIVEAVARDNPKDKAAVEGLTLASGQTVKDGVTDLVNHIRENISLGGFERFESEAVAQYVHFDNKKAAMVALKGGSASDPAVAEAGKQIGMHIVFSKPLSLSRESLDSAVVEKEREIKLAAAQNDPKNAKKPAEILAKIIEGQMEKFVSSQCLLEQPFVRNDKQTVAEFAKSAGLTIEEFTYIATDAE